jgi:hypothetical protein
MMMSSLKLETLSRALAANKLWLLKVTFVNSAVRDVRCLSSISPVFRHLDDDDEPDEHHNGTLFRHISPPQLIETRSPPQLGAAKNTKRPNQESESSETLNITEQQVAASAFVSPSEIQYTGDAVIPITSRLHMVKPGQDAPKGIWPVFRLMVSSLEEG